MENNKIIISGYTYWASNPDEHFPVPVRPEAFDVPIKSQTLIKKGSQEYTVIEFERPLTKMSNVIFQFLSQRPKPGTESEPRNWNNTVWMKCQMNAITLPDSLVDSLPDSYATDWFDAKNGIALEKTEISILGKHAQKDSLWVVDGGVKFWSKRIIKDLGVCLNELTGIRSVPPYFYSRLTLQGKLVLPEGLEQIGEHSFSGIEDMKEIKLPKSLKVIPAYAMSNNRWMTKINLSNVEEIGEFALSKNTLRKVKLGKKLKRIGEGAFTQGIRAGQPIFEGPDVFIQKEGQALLCNDLMILLPAYMNHRFEDPYLNVPEYTVPEGITTIGGHAGELCGKLHFPNTVKRFGKGAFTSNNKITLLELPDSLEVIEEEAFLFCRYLQSITIPPRIIELKKDVFWGCQSLKSITVLGELKVFYHSFFFYSDYTNKGEQSPFEELVIHTQTPPIMIKKEVKNDSSTTYIDNLSIGKIIVPKDSVDAYKSAEGWKEYADNIVAGDF